MGEETESSRDLWQNRYKKPRPLIPSPVFLILPEKAGMWWMMDICCLTLEQTPPKKSSSFMIICNSSRSCGSGGCHCHCIVYEGFWNTQILGATHSWLSPVYYLMSVKETKVHTTMHVRAGIWIQILELCICALFCGLKVYKCWISSRIW